MKVTIEHDGKTDVYEDVHLFAGAVVMDEKTAALSITDMESVDAVKALVYHAAAVNGMRSLLKENRYVMAESFAGLVSEANGEKLFVEEERSEK